MDILLVTLVGLLRPRGELQYDSVHIYIYIFIYLRYELHYLIMNGVHIASPLYIAAVRKEGHLTKI